MKKRRFIITLARMYSPMVMLEFGIRFHFYGFFSGVELSFFNYVLAIGFKTYLVPKNGKMVKILGKN